MKPQQLKVAGIGTFESSNFQHKQTFPDQDIPNSTIYLTSIELSGFEMINSVCVMKGNIFEIPEIEFIFTSKRDEYADQWGVSLIYLEESANIKCIPKIEIGMTCRRFNL